MCRGCRRWDSQTGQRVMGPEAEAWGWEGNNGQREEPWLVEEA